MLRNAANAAQNGSLPRLNCPDKESYYALQYSHPEWLVRLLSEQYGQKLTQKICQADNADAPISVRVNTMKCTPAEAQAELEAAGLTVQPHEGIPGNPAVQRRRRSRASGVYRGPRDRAGRGKRTRGGGR